MSGQGASEKIREFCNVEKFSIAFFYELERRGLGPLMLDVPGTRFRRVVESHEVVAGTDGRARQDRRCQARNRAPPRASGDRGQGRSRIASACLETAEVRGTRRCGGEPIAAGEVMRRLDQNDRDADGGKLAEHLVDQRRVHGVESGGRFVERQYGGAHGKRARDLDEPLVNVRERPAGTSIAPR